MTRIWTNGERTMNNGNEAKEVRIQERKLGQEKARKVNDSVIGQRERA